MLLEVVDVFLESPSITSDNEDNNSYALLHHALT